MASAASYYYGGGGGGEGSGMPSSSNSIYSYTPTAAAGGGGTNQRPPSIALSTAFQDYDTINNQNVRKKKKTQNKISKKQNARMQLAAALIEADNDRIQAKQLIAEAIEEERQALAAESGADPTVRPPLPPQTKLASQSVIFAPFREDPEKDQENEADQEFKGSSTLRHAPSRVRSIQRPQSRDFLGVFLPGEANASNRSRPASVLSTAALSQQYSQRNHNRTSSRYSSKTATSRPGSALSLGRRPGSQGDTQLSRPASLLDPAADGQISRPRSLFSTQDDDADDALSRHRTASILQPSILEPDDGNEDDDDDDAEPRLGEWGMDKFLSEEARQKIARRRQRASSAASLADTPMIRDGSLTGASRTRKGSHVSARSLGNELSQPLDEASEPAHRATSDIVAVGKPTKGTDLELLARIKLYRERQENLPPSQWGERVALSDAPAPAAEVADTGSENLNGNRFVFPATSAVATNEAHKPHEERAPAALNLHSSSSTPLVPEESTISPRHGRISSHQVNPSSGSDLERRESSKGYLGDSWSDAGSTFSHGVHDNASLRSRHQSIHKPSSGFGLLESTVEEEQVPELLVEQDIRPATDDAMMGMAGVGSYSRSQSRRNSMFGLGSEQIDRPDFAGPSADTAGSPQNRSPTMDHKPLRPSPLAHPFPDESQGPLQYPVQRRPPQVGPGNFEATAALQGDLYAALALGSSPYPGSAFNLGRQSPGPNQNPFHQSPTFAQLPLSPSMGANQGLPNVQPSVSFPAMQASSRPTTPMLGAYGDALPSMANLAEPGAGLSTRQLQTLARQAHFPDSYGIITPFLMEEAEIEEKHRKQRHQAQAAGLALPGHNGDDDAASLASLPVDGWVPEPQRGLFSRALKPVGGLLSGGFAVDKLKADLATLEPDLSSSRWGQNKRRYSAGAFKGLNVKKFKDSRDSSSSPSVQMPKPGTTGYEPEVENSLQMQASDAVTEHVSLDQLEDEPSTQDTAAMTEDANDIDDDYISPPSKGPLAPRGLDARLPDALIMPNLLENSPQQPRTRLTEPDEPETRSNMAGQGRRQSGLYVPEGFVLHDGKALPPIQRTTTASGKTRLSFVFPAAAPDGIGRRGNMPSTALFRNQLVQHEEEQEGWGWEKSTAPILDQSADEPEPVALSKKQIKQARKTATKEAKIRYKRKRARAIRRKKRAEAQKQGKSNIEFGVADESPAEDLSLTEDSVGYTDTEEEFDPDFDSDDGKRWVDDQKPAGKLFGKSLMDVAEEKQAQRFANRRYYGQLEIAEQEEFERSNNASGDGQSMMAPSEAGGRTFRDNPLGYNDTRQRMQAAFGVDRNLAREMEDKRLRDARAAEEAEIRRLAEEEYQKAEAERKRRKEEKRNSKRIFLRKNKKKTSAAAADLAAPSGTPDQSETASFKGPQELAASQTDLTAIETAPLTTESAPPPDSPPLPRAPLEAPKLDLGLSDDGGKSANRTGRGRKGVSEAAAEWFAPSTGSSSGDDSDSEDEATRRNRAMHRARLSRSLGGPGMGRLDLAGTALAGIGGGNESSDDDEVPLSQLKRKPVTPVSVNANGKTKKSAMAFGDSSDEDDEEEGMTLDQIKRASKARQSMLPQIVAAAAASDSEEEMPLTQLRAKQSKARQSMMTLDMRLGSVTANDEPDDSDEDQPIGLRHDVDTFASLKRQQLEAAQEARRASRAIRQASGEGNDDVEDSDSSDDAPLGAAHPQAAIIAQQAATIKQLQNEAEQFRLQQEQQHRQSSYNMFGMGTPMGFNMMGTPMGMGPHSGFGVHPSMSMGMPAIGSTMGMPYPGVTDTQVFQGEPNLGQYDANGSATPRMSSLNPISVTTDGFGGQVLSPPTNIDVPSSQPPGFVDPKGASIDRWRNQVLPGSAGASTIDSTGTKSK
ncbi:unnamed protein product [Sympodiomycopsis kandeliae]